jgi:hypothetical protein
VVTPAPQEPAQEPQAGAEGGQDEPRGSEAVLRREAAGYRTRLRDTEAERDTLRGRVDTYERAEVERTLEERMHSPADFWLTVDLDDVRGEDGTPDMKKVEAKVAAMLKERPHWAKRSFALDTAGYRGGPVGSRRGIGEALKDAAGR